MIRSPAGFDGGDRIKRYLDYYQPSYGVTMLSAGQFSPAVLFAAGEQGVWYDPSDFSTMFQDSAGTTPVTAVDQPVGLILDKSGRGNNATQSTSGSRPLVKQDGNGKYYLFFDGTDDWMVTSSINFSATDKITAFAGVRKLSDAARGMLFELGTGTSAVGSFQINAPNSFPADSFAFRTAGTGSQSIATASGLAAPITRVLTGIGAISTDTCILRGNGVEIATGVLDQGAGNYVDAALYIGRRGGSTLPFNGNLYALIIRGAQSTSAAITNTETWVNGKTGAY